jgi:hypothetical protein
MSPFVLSFVTLYAISLLFFTNPRVKAKVVFVPQLEDS